MDNHLFDNCTFTYTPTEHQCDLTIALTETTLIETAGLETVLTRHVQNHACEFRLMKHHGNFEKTPLPIFSHLLLHNAKRYNNVKFHLAINICEHILYIYICIYFIFSIYHTYYYVYLNILGI